MPDEYDREGAGLKLILEAGAFLVGIKQPAAYKASVGVRAMGLIAAAVTHPEWSMAIVRTLEMDSQSYFEDYMRGITAILPVEVAS